MNKVVLVGRTTKEAVLRYTQNGKAVASTTVAVNRSYENQQGEREADFIQVVIWGKRAEAFANHVLKGHRVAVDGRIQTRKFAGEDGKDVYVTEVVAENFEFLEPKKEA